MSGMGKAADLKFNVRIELKARKPKNAKLGQQGRVLRYVTYFFKFWDTLHISGMGIARDFKFGVRIDRQACIAKNAKLGQKVRGLLLVTQFYNFGTPLYL